MKIKVEMTETIARIAAGLDGPSNWHESPPTTEYCEIYFTDHFFGPSTNHVIFAVLDFECAQYSSFVGFTLVMCQRRVGGTSRALVMAPQKHLIR